MECSFLLSTSHHSFLLSLSLHPSCWFLHWACSILLNGHSCQLRYINYEIVLDLTLHILATVINCVGICFANQGIGDSSQGFANCILFLWFTKRVRQGCIAALSRCDCRKHSNEQLQSTSNPSPGDQHVYTVGDDIRIDRGKTCKPTHRALSMHRL